MNEEAYMEEWERQEQAAYEQYKRDYDAAKAKYPNACTNCGGAGVCYSTYDPSPAGVSLGSGTMTDCDICDTCVGNDKCPVCGKEGLTFHETKTEDYCTCPHCGWDERKTEVLFPEW